ncbi:PREDICTED: uncharacterized protein LOC106747319 isoform X2 [Dinoponera quadriceps]|nr:PREDICTED: uncharacterized protein LOC106747319 isoform X2 [Dinoponera quadriceps]XP_014480208.1 PREDICTED: uncharacterized protein LOC106747319 isoform X2 [Dinoponera quadriceps]XP_014480209.1 PREDICTED: uncharacterized protein LOC106747319 isoform X2 [Dinoponera quadriceps]
MSPKRKMITSDVSDEDEDSFKHRRSSLKVNLSYCTDLTDSGNGSLGRTETENNERKMDKSQINKLSNSKHRSNASNKISRATSKENKCAENDKSKVYVQVKEGIQLKHLTINLENINAKEQTLDTNCKRLKDAILSKTNEIFDKQDELSVKTTMVLANQEDCFMNNIHSLNVDKPTIQRFENEESITCNQYSDVADNQQKEDEHFNIDATPKNVEKRRNSDKAVNKSKLTPKRLFAEKDNKQGCKIIEDIVLDKRFSLFPLKLVGPSDSPILSGSNRRLQLLRSQSKLFSQNQSENGNNTHLSACPDHSIDIGQPIICSTFIEDNTKDEERNKHLDNKAKQQGDINISRSMHTINTLVSMEMTEIHNGIQSREEHSPLLSRGLCNSIINRGKGRSSNKSVGQNKSVMSAQRLENIGSSLNKLTLQNRSIHSDIATNHNVTSACINTTVIPVQPASIEEISPTMETHDVLQAQEQNNQSRKQSEKQRTLNLSDGTSIPSSLKVNTSLDVVTETSKRRNVKKSDDRGITATDRCLKITTNNSIVLDNRRESTSTNRTSLQMNTSMDTVCKIWQGKNNCLNKQSPIEDRNNKHSIDCSNVDDRNSPTAEDTEENDADSLENISLIARLRNISTWNRVSHNDKLENSKTGNKERTKDVGSNNVVSAKFQSGNYANSGSRDSHSYVEGTPYPISRSVLFKRQLKHRTQNSDNSTASYGNNSANSASDEENNSRAKSNDSNSTSTSNKMHVLAGTSKELEDYTVILEDTLIRNPFLNQEKPTIIEDIRDKAGLEMDEENTAALQNTEYVSTRRHKRRLLPLNNNSQLYSIEQLEEHSDASEKSTSTRRNKKKLTKKCLKKKPPDSKNDANSVKDNIASEQVSLDNCDIAESKTKENKKNRKPRKIVSKKVVIKKFANKDMLNIIKENKRNKGDLSKENGDSLEDFVAHRTISSQWNKHKSQKIVIVTTGLSKGDKSLVKSIVKSLGMAEIQLNVSRRTTHVVSTGVRTVNLLRGIIRGCWLITLEWVLKSLESNVWLNPEEFEMKHFSKAVLENRKDRQLFGPSYIPELFTACGLIYVEHKTTLPCDTLKELIKTAGGYITENPKLARIIVGADGGLKETWVIDSITTGELQSIKLYQKK